MLENQLQVYHHEGEGHKKFKVGESNWVNSQENNEPCPTSSLSTALKMVSAIM